MEPIPTNTFLEFPTVMKKELHYAVFVKLNGNTDNARSGNAGFFLTPVMETLVFNTKYIQYTSMTNYIQKAENLTKKLEKQIDEFVNLSYIQGQIDLVDGLEQQAKDGHDIEDMMNLMFRINKTMKKDLEKKGSKSDFVPKTKYIRN